MAALTTPITEQERAERRARITQAMASVGLEGLAPSDGAKRIFDLYIAGERTLDEAGEEIRALHARRRGSVRLPEQ